MRGPGPGQTPGMATNPQAPQDQVGGMPQVVCAQGQRSLCLRFQDGELSIQDGELSKMVRYKYHR